MEELIIDGKEVYINTDKIPKEATGIYIPTSEEQLEKTLELKPIDKEKLLEDTLTDILGENNG